MKITCLKSLVVGCAGVVGIAVSPVVFAGNKAGDGDQMMKMMDSNSDGKISPEEHAAGVQKMFEMMDANKDGKVTVVEMEASHEKMMGKKADKMEMSAADKIKKMDTNNDGALTAEEHAVGAKKMFEMMDTDKDGSLTKTEMMAGHAKMMRK